MSGTASAQEIPEDASFKDRKVNEGFTLNLKELIDKSKKKIEQVDGKLKDQARERRNKQREEKAREYYDKAMAYFEQGELEAARELWEKAIKITEHEEMDGYLDKSVRRQRKEEKVFEKEEERRIKRLEVERGYTAKEVNKKYKEGVKLYKDKSFLAAKVVFEEVDQMFPDHKATKSYLALIDRKIEDEQKDIINSKLQNKELTSAKAKARWKKELEEQEEIRQRNLYKQADASYKEAKRLYKDKQFSKAKDKFKEVEWILPDYKDTIKYLSKIDADIAKNGVQFSEEDKLKYFKNQIKQIRKNEENESKSQVKLEEVKGFSEKRRRLEEAAFVYEAAQTLRKKKYYEQALEKFYEVNALSPDYKSTVKYIKKLEKKVPGTSKSKISKISEKSVQKSDEQTQAPSVKNEAVVKAINDRQQEKLSQAEEDYQQALKFYNERNYIEAQKKFIDVEAILPAYKATREYLGHIDGDMTKETTEVMVKSPGMKQEKNKNLKNKGEFSPDANYKDTYKQAKKLYGKKQFEAAKALFVAVNDARPGYRSTLKYISKINKNINGMAKHQQPKKLAKNTVQSPTSSSSFSLAETRNDPAAAEETKPLDKQISEHEKKYQNAMDAVKNSGTETNEKYLDDVVGQTYEEALALYKLERFSAAKAKFETVKGLRQGYKQTEAYIKESEQRITLKENSGLDDQLKPLSSDPVKQNDSLRHESIKKKPREKYSENMNMADTELEEVIRFGSESEVKELYNLGKRLYKAKNYQKARNIFTVIHDKYPAYKSTTSYLAKIDRLIEDERLQREKFQQLASQQRKNKPAKDDHQKAVGSGQKDAITSATIEKDQKIKQQTENYFNAIDRLSAEKKKEYEANQDFLKKQYSVQQKSVVDESSLSLERMKSITKQEYDMAIRLYKSGQYAEAKDKFLTVEQLQPGFKRASHYIDKIDRVSSEKHSRWFLKRMKQMKKEENLLRAEADAVAMAKSMRNGPEDYIPMPENEYKDKIEQWHSRDSAEIEKAKMVRLQRLEEEKIEEVEQSVVFQREVKRKLKEMEKQKAEDEKRRKEYDSKVKEEEQKRIREEISKRKELKKKALKDLAAIKKETIRLLKKNETGHAKEMMFKYEDLIAQGDFSEKERLALRNKLSKEKIKIQKVQDEIRQKEERLAYNKLDKTPEDENKLKILQQRELDEIEGRIREEERKLREAQKKEEERLKRVSIQKERQMNSIKEKPVEAVQTHAELKTDRTVMDRKSIADLEKKKKMEIEQMVLERKKELKKKREDIQKEFDKSLTILYKKAERYHKKGLNQESRKIFEEIHRLRPGYKNTEVYLAEIYRADVARPKDIPTRNNTYVKEKTMPTETPFSRPAEHTKMNRVEIIKNTLDTFEEKMW
ncbi:MAG: hypothetical protein AB7S78_04805 [Candidatus Omnitrophota bacterium]